TMAPQNRRPLVSHTKPGAKYLAQLRKRYAKSSKKNKIAILNEFVATTGYHRKHASTLLSGKRHWRDPQVPLHRARRARYTAEDQRALLQLVELFDDIGSKRVRVALDTELANLRRNGHLKVSRHCYEHLGTVSPSTMDRWRRAARRPGRKLRGGTKPGTLLKHQIPIRTFAEWDDKRPGFGEMDLVQHAGGTTKGDFACTLTFTDVVTSWTELAATRNKAQVNVFAALETERARLPFPLLGLDSDNGAEFINDELKRYCEREQITFTRARVGRKNDQAFVEEKNWSVVRRLVGYGRYDTPKQIAQLNALYPVYCLYFNHFLPVTKLVKTERHGSRLKKIYDKPKTPYQRVLDAPEVSDVLKAKLRRAHAKLDVFVLKRHVDELVAALKPTRQW
ncbi:MAG: integrase catalytic domain-containing protein, partial [Blastocatellia bacterium]